MRTQKRPGVLLLIVLALLAMFGVMAIAFVILAGTTRRGADALRKVGQYDDQPEKVLNQAALDLFRGSNNHQSPLQAHGLLENLYGNESFTGYIGNPTALPGDYATGVIGTSVNVTGAGATPAGQLIQFNFYQGQNPPAPPSLPPPLPSQKQFFAEQHLGAVLTIVGPASSPLLGCSTHIVAGATNGITAPQASLQIAAFENTNLTPQRVLNALNSYQHTCLINGMPYGGTGFGFNPVAVSSGATFYNGATDASGWAYSDQPSGVKGWEFALLPNHAAFPYDANDPCYPQSGATPATPSYVNWLSNAADPAGPGGANVDYTAPDYQNMFLALRLTTPTTAGTQITINGTLVTIPPTSVPSPSFHRPELINFWMNRSATTKGTGGTNSIAWFDPLYGPILQRKVLQRPLAQFRASTFNGGSFSGYSGKIPINPGIPDLPEFVKVGTGWVPGPLITGPWDVDNDGDGIADSVWIDPGYEVRSTPDGRLYKPLVAILCVDMDGRLNLNAHGSSNQVDATFNKNPSIGSNLMYAGGNATLTDGTLPSGQMGWGPADINLSPLFVNQTTEYQQLLTGNGALNGRYYPSALTSGSAPDDLSANKEFNYPSNYLYALGANNVNAPSYTAGSTTAVNTASLDTRAGCYGAPGDLQGMMFTGLDYRGQPIYGVVGTGSAVGSMSGCMSALCGNWTANVRSGNPYELDLSLGQPRGLRPSAPFNPFSVAELEPILRPFDRDTMTLPNRLLKLSPTCLGNASAGMAAKVTTESWDLPCPSLAAPASLLPSVSGTITIPNPAGGTPPTKTICDGRVRHITDLLRAAGVTTGNMASLLPPDILAGLRMDINSPFGNGIDDNGNGVVDEPAESNPGQEQMPYVTPGTAMPTTPPSPLPTTWPRMDYANKGTTPTGGAPSATNPLVDPRQMLFRYLYVLGMMLSDPNTAPPGGTWPSTGSPMLGSIYATSTQEARARWIAQWAANVISFRDRDSIMKPFAYDPSFLSSTSKGTWNPPTDGLHVVFSAERPELLITETLAFHETRAEVFANPKYDSNDATKGPQFYLMQRMRPQGSLYIELFNPWSATEAPPAEFYYDRTNTTNAWQQGVVLNQTTPADSSGNCYPVWRLSIPTPPAAALPAGSPDLRDPDDPNVPATFTIERSIYFKAPTLTGIPKTILPNDGANAQFYPSSTATSNPPVLLHNHYALIGPPSSESSATAAGTWLSQPISGSNPAMIVLDPTKYVPSQNLTNPSTTNFPAQVPNNSSDLPVDQIKQPLPIVMDQAQASGGGGALSPLPRLSISEPVVSGATYPVPSAGTDSVSNNPTYGSSPPPDKPAPNSPLLPNEPPLDGLPSGAQSDGTANPVTPVTINGTAVGAMAGSVTVTPVATACRVVHLQRLANPMMPYDNNTGNLHLISGTGTAADGQIDWTTSTYNPYRTVDSMPIDLTVYNGWATTGNLSNLSITDQKPSPAFKSRQRGDYVFSTAGVGNNILWAQEWQPTTAAYSTTTTLSNQVYQYPLEHTLGYVNYGYWGSAGGTPGNPKYTAPSIASATAPEYYGDPPTGAPFPWLTWNNRPFCSPMEVLLVPATSSSQLLYSYAIPNASPTTTYPGDANNPYVSATQPFAHLLNFLYSQAPTGTPTPPPAPQFYRILEYLRVPSRFVGTEVQVNPAFCGDGTGTHFFHPPYNRISRCRDPGRMNLNTLNDLDVWNGLMMGAPGLFQLNPLNAPVFANFLYSRKSYPSGSVNSGTNLVGTLTELNANLPTRFANPFRSFEGAHLVPLQALYQAVTSPQQGLNPAVNIDINATLLRQDPTNINRSLFGFDAGLSGGTAGSGRQYNNDERNPYFRYQNLQRLENLTTTRSNVFAVWITVGYFQVQKAPQVTTWGLPATLQQFIYPDGYQIIGELGADTGEVKRHRAFYIFDRSIPMGFQRGNDNNVSNGILLSRMIE